jgi:hypothetical protein
MEERRKLPRKYLIAFSTVLDNGTSEKLGYLCDLTLEGLMVISKMPRDSGTEIELYIELPETPDFPQKSLEVQTLIIWCEADIDPRLYNIGFQFIDLSKEEKDIIEQMIESYEFNREQDMFPPSVAELNREF